MSVVIRGQVRGLSMLWKSGLVLETTSNGQTGFGECKPWIDHWLWSSHRTLSDMPEALDRLCMQCIPVVRA